MCLDTPMAIGEGSATVYTDAAPLSPQPTSPDATLPKLHKLRGERGAKGGVGPCSRLHVEPPPTSVGGIHEALGLSSL